MNLANLLPKAFVASMFADDLTRNAASRKAVFDQLKFARKQLQDLSVKSIVEIDSEIQKTEKKLLDLKANRALLIMKDSAARQALADKIKKLEVEIQRQAPAIIKSCRYSIMDKIRHKGLITSAEALLAKQLLDELDTLTLSVDDGLICKSVEVIERKAQSL